MKNYLLSIYLLGILYMSCVDKNQNITLIHDFYGGKVSDTTNIYLETFKIGKPAIPLLIEYIDGDNKRIVGFPNPYSSTIGAFDIPNYEGIIAAYAIELILAKDSLSGNKITYEGTTQINPFKIYSYCVIARVENGVETQKELTLDDMKIIKNTYRTWWNKNKDKSIEELRNEWKQGKFILSNSGYKWV